MKTILAWLRSIGSEITPTLADNGQPDWLMTNPYGYVWRSTPATRQVWMDRNYGGATHPKDIKNEIS